MSNLALTAAFGPSTRFHPGPKHVLVLGQLVVGGSAVFIFNRLMNAGPTIRIRPESGSLADVLMAGFAITESDLELQGKAAQLVESFRASTGSDIILGADAAATLAEAVADIGVAVLVTLNEPGEGVEPDDFRGWEVTVSSASPAGEVFQPAVGEEGDVESISELDAIEDHLRHLSERDAPRAQQTLVHLLSNYAHWDGFLVDFGDYGPGASLEILGEDGRRVVVAPLFKWAEGDTEESLSEWSMRDKDGGLIVAPEDLQDFEDSEIWGDDGFGLDLPSAIQFYRNAIDEANRLVGFQPAAPRMT